MRGCTCRQKAAMLWICAMFGQGKEAFMVQRDGRLSTATTPECRRQGLGRKWVCFVVAASIRRVPA